ncbi:MAG: glycoside hydrolase family 5 protein, partial [Proteobacteria bacterium]|nr:glycoside hydrolase family 5 protein [Pseudomonadota bacterium]
MVRTRHAEGPYTIDPKFMQRVQQVVDWALAAKLLVVLDLHHYDEIHQNPFGHQVRLLELWYQIASHFASYPPELLFEPLNEPTGNFSADDWNNILANCINKIREKNPERFIIIGPVQWNSAWQLETLKLPSEDRHIIPTVHIYEPYKFTHSGAPWTQEKFPAGATWSAQGEDKDIVDRVLAFTAEWMQRENRPIYVGEFGVFQSAEAKSRSRYIRYIAESMNRLGFSWS